MLDVSIRVPVLTQENPNRTPVVVDSLAGPSFLLCRAARAHCAAETKRFWELLSNERWERHGKKQNKACYSGSKIKDNVFVKPPKTGGNSTGGYVTSFKCLNLFYKSFPPPALSFLSLRPLVKPNHRTGLEAMMGFDNSSTTMRYFASLPGITPLGPLDGERLRR